MYHFTKTNPSGAFMRYFLCIMLNKLSLVKKSANHDTYKSPLEVFHRFAVDGLRVDFSKLISDVKRAYNKTGVRAA